MKPIVAVVPLVDYERNSYWMIPGYMLALEKAGAIPMILPLEASREDIEQIMGSCNAVLLTGGQDVDPAIYGEATHAKCGAPSIERDRLEAWLIEIALRDGKPLLGICRGIQFLNATLGGTLYQDLPDQHPSESVHCMTPPYDRAIHEVEILENTELAALIGAGIKGVNSYHHQAIKDLAPGLEVMAVSTDGLVEAVRVAGQRFAWAVQWHPELSYKVNEDSMKIFRAFVEAAA